MLQSFASGFFPRMRLQKYTFFSIQQKENASGSNISQRRSLQYVFMFILILLFYDILTIMVSWCKRTIITYSFLFTFSNSSSSAYLIIGIPLCCFRTVRSLSPLTM